MNEASKTTSTSFASFCFKSLTTFSPIMRVSLSSPTFRLNLLRTLLGYAASLFFIRHSFLSRGSTSSSLVISLRLRTPFMHACMKFVNDIRKEKQFRVLYEPEQFPAAIVKFPVGQGSEATILLFTSGKIVCVGLTTYD